MQKLRAVTRGFVEGSPVQVTVAEDCSSQVGFLEVGVAQSAVLEKRAPHGRCGCVDAIEAGAADAGVVQAGTPERDPSQVEWCLLGSYCPAAQVGVCQVQGVGARVGRSLVERAQRVGEDVCSCGCACVPANVCEPGEPLSLRVRGKAVDELREEREGLVAGAGDAPGRPSLILRLGLKGVGEANGQEVLQERGVLEGEIIPAAGQEGRGAEVLLPLVRHASRVVQFHVWVGVKEFEHPVLHPARRPCPGS